MKDHVIANGQFCIKRNFTRYYNNVLLYRAAFSPAAAARLPFALGWTCGSWFVVLWCSVLLWWCLVLLC
jgi:hypothetical protein